MTDLSKSITSRSNSPSPRRELEHDRRKLRRHSKESSCHEQFPTFLTTVASHRETKEAIPCHAREFQAAVWVKEFSSTSSFVPGCPPIIELEPSKLLLRDPPSQRGPDFSVEMARFSEMAEKIEKKVHLGESIRRDSIWRSQLDRRRFDILSQGTFGWKSSNVESELNGQWNENWISEWNDRSKISTVSSFGEFVRKFPKERGP